MSLFSENVSYLDKNPKCYKRRKSKNVPNWKKLRKGKTGKIENCQKKRQNVNQSK